MGSRHSPGNQVRNLYALKDDPILDGLKAQMLGPARAVNDLAIQFGTTATVSSAVRIGEDTAHGHGFAMDWAVDAAHGDVLARRMNQLWGQDYVFDYHPNRIGTDKKTGKPIFSQTEKHLHGQLKKNVYRAILDRTPKVDTPRLKSDAGTPVPQEPKRPGDPNTIANLGASSRRVPVNTAKSAHLNTVSSKVEQGPELPPNVQAGGFALPGGPRGRPGDARSVANRDQLKRANAASGRSTLIGGN